MDKFLIPEEFSLDDIFKGKYLIPIYQRPYSWGEKQVNQLLTDIDEAYVCFRNQGAGNADDSVLFAGTIFIKTEANIRNEYTEYTVVDGQQRITTLTLLLMSMLNHFYLVNSEDDIVGEIKNYLWKKEERKNDKTKPVLSLGNIDADILKALFNELYSKNDIVKYSKEKLEDNCNEIERNLLNNFLIITNHFKFSTEDEYYNYMDFIKYNIKVISIKINTNMVKLFSIFESINSKGKPLDDIDLIKSYIFQNLKQSDYDEYLEKWGELIRQTKDNLNDYFTVYIRGNIAYYKTSIKLDNFKLLTSGTLQRYYEKESLDDVLKEFINDMLKQVKYYNMLSDFGLLKNAGVSEKSIAFFRMNQLAKYNHTEPLYFKLLSLRGNGINDEKFDEIIEYAFRFILTFQTISSRESKQTISVFSTVQEELYSIFQTRGTMAEVDEHAIENIKYAFNKMIYDNSITNKNLKVSIHNSMTYKKNKNAVKLLLAYLLEYNSDENKEDYLKLNAVLGLGGDIHVDHILPQNPNENSSFMYYPVETLMMLKPGQDFTDNPEQEKMPVSDFQDMYIHRFGNLRLAWSNDNIKKSNNLIKLEEFDELFNCNAKVVAREKDLIDKIIESDFLISTDNYSFSPNSYKAKRQMEVSYGNSEQIDYKDYYPISFSLFGEVRQLSKFSYRHLLSELFEVLYDLEKDRLVELANEHFYLTNSGRAYISNTKEDIRTPYGLGNAVFIEQNLSSEYIMIFVYKVIDEMGLSSDDLTVMLEER